jgi:hypothetical protein
MVIGEASAAPVTSFVTARTVVPVPLLGQHYDPSAWRRDGFLSKAESVAWGGRSCGIACVRMLLLACFGTAPPMAVLLHDALGIGAYCDAGWIHSGLVELGRRHGLDGVAAPMDRHELTAALDDGLAPIVSVTAQLPVDGRRGGHLVVLHGRAGVGPEADLLLFRDPSRWGESHGEVSSDRLMASYSGRAILLWPAGRSPAGGPDTPPR